MNGYITFISFACIILFPYANHAQISVLKDINYTLGTKKEGIACQQACIIASFSHTIPVALKETDNTSTQKCKEFTFGPISYHKKTVHKLYKIMRANISHHYTWSIKNSANALSLTITYNPDEIVLVYETSPSVHHEYSWTLKLFNKKTLCNNDKPRLYLACSALRQIITYS